MQVLVAMTYADEIGAISGRGPEALQDKIASLAEGERTLPREALAAA